MIPGCRRATRQSRPIGLIRRALTGSRLRNRVRSVGQLGGGGIPVGGALGQRLEDDRFQVARDARVDRAGRHRLVLADLVDQLGGGLAVERRAQGQQLVEGRAQAVDVGPAVDRAGAGLLGAHVSRRAEQAVVVGQARVGQPASQAEVGDPDAPLGIDQQVGRLDVAVDHALVVCMREGVGRLEADLGDPAEVGRPARGIKRRRLVVAPALVRLGRGGVPAERRRRPRAGPRLRRRRWTGRGPCLPAVSHEAVESASPAAERRPMPLPLAGRGIGSTERAVREPAPSAPGRGPELPGQPSRGNPAQNRLSREWIDDAARGGLRVIGRGPRAGRTVPARGGRRAGAAEMAEHAIQPASLDPLHGVIAQPADLADVEDRHDVGVVQPGGGAGLVQRTAAAPMSRAQRGCPAP